VRALRVLLVFFAALVLSACQVDAVVDVIVTEDGSGTVTLTAAFDEEIVEAVPEIADGLRTSDLVSAGWVVDGPRRAETGNAVVVSATKPFASPDDLGGVLDEIAGAGTLFSDFQVERTRSFARTTYEVTGKIDPRISLTTFGDESITGLVGAPLGMSLAELQAAAGRPLEETVSLEFAISLPDTVQAVTSSIEDRLPRIWAAVALVALALLATLLIFRILARFGGRRTDERGEEVVQMRRPEKAPTWPNR